MARQGMGVVLDRKCVKTKKKKEILYNPKIENPNR
jgi:hypothetical protein